MIMGLIAVAIGILMIILGIRSFIKDFKAKGYSGMADAVVVKVEEERRGEGLLRQGSIRRLSLPLPMWLPARNIPMPTGEAGEAMVTSPDRRSEFDTIRQGRNIIS